MRRVYVAFAIAAIALSLIPGAAGAARPGQLSPAAESLSRCVQDGGRLSVLMLIDESGSLAATDPYNQRVDGIKAALTGLADLSATSVGGRQPEVSVLMAGFYGLVHPDPRKGVPSGAWKPVGDANIDALLNEAEQYGALNHGKATDYVTALVAAKELLAARAAEQTQAGGVAPCQALIWFTDGRYALPRRVGKAGVGLPSTLPYAPGIRLDQPGAEKRAVAAGKRFMCEPNGLMDELQGDEVIRFTVALSSDLAPADAAFLDAATTGAGAGQRCGVHLSRMSGEYLTARDGDRLFFAFAGLLGSSPPIQVHPVCPKLSCVRGVTSFDTVPGLSQFSIRASGGAQRSGGKAPAALELELNGPGGESVTLSPEGPSHLSIADTRITQRWVSDRAVEVKGDFSTGKRRWLGRWSYAFVEPSAAAGSPTTRGYSSVQLFADLVPAVDGPPVLIRGSPTSLEFKLTHGTSPDQSVSTGALVRSAHLLATVEDPVAGTSTHVPVVGPKPDGTFSATVEIPSSSTAGFVYLGLTASFSTPGGTPIAPQYRAFDVPVRFPPGQGFPTISPSTLDLPSLRGTGTAEGELTVKGSSVSSGCVWFEVPEVDAPSEAGKVEATILPRTGSAERCIPIEKGEERHFTVHLEPAAEARGTVTASVPVHLSSDIVETEHVVSVPASFAMGPPPDDVTRVLLLVGLVLLGTLLPLLLLHGLNLLGARFTAPNQLRAIAIPVEMSRGGPLRRNGDDGRAVELGRGESLVGEGTRPVRELKFDGLDFEAVASGSLGDRAFELFRGPYGVVRSKSVTLVAGAAQPLRSWHDGTSHEVPLGLAGTWIFRFDDLRPAQAEDPTRASEPYVETAPSAAGMDFFAAPPKADPEKVEVPTGPREATIEGRLVLLISDGPPVDQAEVLFGQAEEGLRGAERLWREETSESEPTSAPDPGEPDEGEAASEPPPPARPEATDWMPSSEPEPPPRKRRGEQGNGDFF
jgi:hypothetical protein